MSTEERVTRRLAYAGQRFSGDKVVHAWYDEDDFEGSGYIWDRLKAIAVGSVYTVEALASDTGSVYPGTLTYTGEQVDDSDVVALWQARDSETRRTVQMQRAEKRAAKSSELDEALEPLLRLARKARTRNDATALSRLASERVLEAYWKEHG